MTTTPACFCPMHRSRIRPSLMSFLPEQRFGSQCWKSQAAAGEFEEKVILGIELMILVGGYLPRNGGCLGPVPASISSAERGTRVPPWRSLVAFGFLGPFLPIVAKQFKYRE